ncbi:MAG: hypothetical protein P8181_01810 [bacterium]
MNLPENIDDSTRDTHIQLADMSRLLEIMNNDDAKHSFKTLDLSKVPEP